MRHVLFALALVGCAKGGVGQLAQGDANEIVIDGTVYKDAPDDPHDDAHVYMDAKQFEDAHIFNDAHVYMDAHVFNDAHAYMDAHVYMDACSMVQTELLAHGDFEAFTTGWHEVQPADAPSELISNHLPQAGTYGGWLGSYDTGFTESDELFQDVAIPAGTTVLTLTGYWLVGTTETSTTNVYDSSVVSLAQTNETPIETALSVNNLNSTTGTTYTAFSHSFAVAGIAGTTVRFKMASTSDFSKLTNFFYDTLSLKATHCM
ncbi:MAG: hypothetical protein ABI591_09815 [Kofleriaceae bacterium]